MSVQNNDPFAAAVADAESVNHLFGKMTAEAQFIVLRTGEKARAWIEGESIENRMVQITFRLNPLDVMGMTKAIEKQVKSGFSDFTRIVWPSLQKLGCKNPGEINDKYVHVEMVPQQKGSEWTTFKFLNVYETEGDCIKAWEVFKGKDASPAVSQTNDANRLAALQFLSHVVLQNKDNAVALEAALKTTPLVKDFFTITSPEVIEILTPFGS